MNCYKVVTTLLVVNKGPCHNFVTNLTLECQPCNMLINHVHVTARLAFSVWVAAWEMVPLEKYTVHEFVRLSDLDQYNMIFLKWKLLVPFPKENDWVPIVSPLPPSYFQTVSVRLLIAQEYLNNDFFLHLLAYNYQKMQRITPFLICFQKMCLALSSRGKVCT